MQRLFFGEKIWHTFYRRSYSSGDNGNRVMHKLNEALDMASTEEEKNAIRDIINRMSH